MTSRDNEETLGANGSQLVVAYGEGKWSDLLDVPLIGGRLERAVLLPMGTHGARHSVELLVRTANGDLVHANTTYALFQGMAQQFQAWYDRS